MSKWLDPRVPLRSIPNVDLVTESMNAIGFLNDRLTSICMRYDISSMYAFGSRALEMSQLLKEGSEASADSNHQASDLDIGVQPTQGSLRTSKERVELTIELEDLFEVPRVDLIILPEAEPFLALDVISGELLYSADLDQQAEEELFILRRAGDIAHFEHERRRLALRTTTR